MSTLAQRWTPWFPAPAAAGAELRLVALPYAGGGTQAFAPWAAHVPRRVALLPARLPGRETRLGEPPSRSVEPLARELAEVVAGHVEPPYVLYGHSLGAIVAYELARELRAAGAEPPLGLVVSARQAPDVPRDRPPAHTLPRERLVAELLGLGGLPEPVARSPELLDLFLPLLRADLEVNEAYAHRPGPPLDVPLLALAGRDDPRIRPHDVAQWARHTTRGFRFEALPGGHFFPFDRPADVVSLIVRQIDAWCDDG